MAKNRILILVISLLCVLALTSSCKKDDDPVKVLNDQTAWADTTYSRYCTLAQTVSIFEANRYLADELKKQIDDGKEKSYGVALLRLKVLGQCL